MKKFLKYSLASILIVIFAFGIYIYTSGYRIEVQEKGIKSDIFLKGFENAIALENDNDGNYFVCYENEIVKINKDNMTEKIYTNNNLQIEDAIFFEDSLILLSKGDLLKINVKDGNIDRILKEIPFGGERIKRKLLAKDDKILLAVGSFTNTGISEKGDEFTKELWDKSSVDLEVTGENFGEGNTGVFKKYGEKNTEGEKIKGENIGNSAIYEIDLEKKEAKLFASGIKNILSWDLNSKDEIIGTIEGLEPEGPRGALRDTDHIYKITKGTWYGWPDYSGGDKINSSKFSDGENIKLAIKKPLEEVVAGPYYEHKNLSSISEMAIDKDGSVLEEDTILFFDSKEKKIFSINDKKIVEEFLTLDKKSDIKDILFLDTECLLLDSESGYIYRLEKARLSFIGNIPKSIVIILVITFLVILLIVAKKVLDRSRNIKK